MLISQEEINRLSKKMHCKPEEWKAMYTYPLGKNKQSLREKKNLDCIFFQKDTGCKIYQDRPRQCQTWPFWNRILSSKKTWEEESKECAGMNQGTLVDSCDIIKFLS